jgi:hypothetical protein
MIDTLRLSKRLCDEAGMSPEEAESTSGIINDALADMSVAKADLAAAETRIKAHIDRARNTQIAWTVGALIAIGLMLHFFR